MERLADRVAIVTGAAGAIGAACAERLAAEGCAVVCVDLDAGATAHVAAAIQERGGRADAIAADVSRDAGNVAAVAAARDRFGGLDAFLANAAIQVVGAPEDEDTDTWHRLFDTNLYGVAAGFRAALPELRRRGGGSLIATASVLGIVGDPQLAAYGAMKGGLRALVRSLASAWGGDGVRANAICPGDVETPMSQQFLAAQPDPAAAERRITERIPLGRFARPADVAAVAAFLASDDAAYVTGTDIVVDGGLLARIY